jgi:hypothetical protein
MAYALSGTGRSPNRSAEVGARDDLRRWLGLLEALDYGGVRRALARRAPFQGLAYLHLVLGSLQPEYESRPGTIPRVRRLGHGMLR